MTPRALLPDRLVSEVGASGVPRFRCGFVL